MFSEIVVSLTFCALVVRYFLGIIMFCVMIINSDHQQTSLAKSSMNHLLHLQLLEQPQSLI